MTEKEQKPRDDKMLAENFVVKGTFFQAKPEAEDFKSSLDRIKSMLIESLRSKGYKYFGPVSSLYKYLEMEFRRWIPSEKKSFLKRRPDPSKTYFKALENTRNDSPWTIRVYLYYGKFKGSEGVFIEITSEPAIFYKITQLQPDITIREEEYSYIVYTNKEFVGGVAKSLACVSVKEPKTLVEYIKTEVSEKLKTFNFGRIADLMENGRKQIELGKTQYGLGDLRAATENFLFELINKLGEKPYPLDKPEKNIELLGSMGYLDEKPKGLITKTLYNGIYKILSDKTTHRRESVNLFDARLYFNLTEQIFDYLLDKIMKYKIKVK